MAAGPAGVQSRAVILKGRSIFVSLLASVADKTASTVPACFKSDPNKAIWFPSM